MRPSSSAPAVHISLPDGHIIGFSRCKAPDIIIMWKELFLFFSFLAVFLSYIYIYGMKNLRVIQHSFLTSSFLFFRCSFSFVVVFFHNLFFFFFFFFNGCSRCIRLLHIIVVLSIIYYIIFLSTLISLYLSIYLYYIIYGV